MRLSTLISSLPHPKVIGNPGVEVKGIAYDSRRVERGLAFVALKGRTCDGHSFIGEAIDKGASVLLVERPQPGLQGIPQVVVSDTRKAMAVVSSIFYGEPSKRLTLIGVTGTNGKTTTTYLIESILQKAGHKVGVVGTINYRYPGHILPAPHTTPEAPDIQRILKEMLDNRVTHCVMEVSSHALSQMRVDGCRFAGAVFTNLSQDHLDYHITMDDYFRSKSRLFQDLLPQGAFAVINGDDPWGRRLLNFKSQISTPDLIRGRFIRYSLKQDAEIKPADGLFSEKGVEAILNTPIGPVKISSSLLGEYNLQNIMAAVGVGIGLGLNKSAIEEGVEALKTVPGRLERIPSSDGFQGIVDYAHTADALLKVLTILRSITQRRLITVFGCGGNRDRGKRPIMGEVATRLSDITIITSDNPRGEDPLEIIKGIEAGIRGCPKVEMQWSVVRGQWSGSAASSLITHHLPLKCYTVIPDRREAIKVAIGLAIPEDIVLVAGKGHEDYQIIGDRRFPFDDAKEVRKAIEDRHEA